MGTYIKIRLLDKSEKGIKIANELIEKLGYPTEIYEGVTYGYFMSRNRLIEDARFMNEDEEGLEQMPHFERPITVKTLQEFFWNEIGCGLVKLNSDDSEMVPVISFLKDEQCKKLIDWTTSEHIDEYNPAKINLMLAEDLFEQDAKQVFDKRTGEWLGMVKDGEEIPKSFFKEKVAPVVTKSDLNQLSIF